MAKRKNGRPQGNEWKGYRPSIQRHAWNQPDWSPPYETGEIPTVVKLMPDYFAELPLWLAEWWDLGLAPKLLDRLADWQETFDRHFDASKGWSDQATRATWERESERLITELRKALPKSVQLEVNLWPLARP